MLDTLWKDHVRNVVYECVDKDAESVPGSATDINGALFYHTIATCTGLPCPPYICYNRNNYMSYVY